MTRRDDHPQEGDAVPNDDIRAALRQLGIDPKDEMIKVLEERPQGSVLPAGYVPGLTELRVDTSSLAGPSAGVSRSRHSRDERGSISVWFATASFAMIILVGMAVDLGGKVHTQQQARSAAAQAARTGAQEVQGSTAVRGEDLRVDINAAKAAAQDYLHAAGVEGTARVVNGDTLIVTTTDTYTSKFLGIIGLDSMQVTGEASARLIRAEGGIER